VAAGHPTQQRHLLLEIRHQVQKIHDLPQTRPVDMAQLSQLGLIGHRPAGQEMLEPLGQQPARAVRLLLVRPIVMVIAPRPSFYFASYNRHALRRGDAQADAVASDFKDTYNDVCTNMDGFV